MAAATGARSTSAAAVRAAVAAATEAGVAAVAVAFRPRPRPWPAPRGRPRQRRAAAAVSASGNPSASDRHVAKARRRSSARFVHRPSGRPAQRQRRRWRSTGFRFVGVDPRHRRRRHWPRRPSHAGRAGSPARSVGGRRLWHGQRTRQELARLAPDADVLVDFTTGHAAPDILQAAVAAGLHVVSGTSGLPPEALDALDAALQKAGQGGLWAANFAIGGALMMHFARVAARFMDAAEVIELHHDGQGRRAVRHRHPDRPRHPRGARQRPARSAGQAPDTRRLAGRGRMGGVRIHSVRLPGFNAHQEVLFGSSGPGPEHSPRCAGPRRLPARSRAGSPRSPETRWPGAGTGYTHGSSMSYAIGVVGATGQVGREFLRILDEGDRPDLPIGRLRLFASERSAGTRITVRGQEHVVERAEPDPRPLQGLDFVLSAIGDEQAKLISPGHRARGRAQRRQVECLAHGPDGAAGGPRGQPGGRARRTAASSLARIARPPRWWSRCGRFTRSTRSSGSSWTRIRPFRAPAGAPSTNCRRRLRRRFAAARRVPAPDPSERHPRDRQLQGRRRVRRRAEDDRRDAQDLPRADLPISATCVRVPGGRGPLRGHPSRARAADAARTRRARSCEPRLASSCSTIRVRPSTPCR